MALRLRRPRRSIHQLRRSPRWRASSSSWTVATRVVAAAKVELARDLVESFDYKAFKDFAARRFCE